MLTLSALRSEATNEPLTSIVGLIIALSAPSIGTLTSPLRRSLSSDNELIDEIVASAAESDPLIVPPTTKRHMRSRSGSPNILTAFESAAV